MNHNHFTANAETMSNAGSSSSTTLPANAVDDKEHKERDDHITDSNPEGHPSGNPSTSQEKPKDDTDHDEYEVKWDGLNDPENPKALKKSTKWFVTLVVSMGALCVTCNSSIYTSTYGQLQHEFHVSEIVVILGLSLFVAGLGVGPMVLAPLSEFYGRRPIYIISLFVYLLFLIPCAVAKNIQTMLVARFLTGVAGSAFLSVAGGTVGDMFAKEDLSFPMMIFTASPFIGPELGPLLGGFINQYTNWRWTFYVMIIWTGVLLITLCFAPETYNPVLLQRKAQRLRSETGNQAYYAPIEKLNSNRSIPRTILFSCARPFQILFYEPIALLLCTYTALLLGCLYLFFEAFNLVFMNNHDFTLSQVGLSFLGLFVGMIIGISTDPLWHRNYVRLIKNRNGVDIPEFRLPPAMLGGVLVPIGLFWFAWTTYRSVHWIVPIIGSVFFGTGTLLVFSGVFTFLVQAYPEYAASALAANSFCRSSFAAAFPLFANPMYNKLGYQWATTILAFLTLILTPFPFLFFKYGERIRRKTKFAKKT